MDGKNVWEKYRALHRYVQLVRRTGGTPIPESLSPEPHGAKQIEAIEKLRQLAETAYRTCPMLVSDDYFLYLFLFVQLLRVNFRQAPVFTTPAEGWRQLGWYPIHVLAGKVGAAGPLGAWNAWYYRNWQVVYPHPTEAELRLRFPMIEKQAEDAVSTITYQRKKLLELCGVNRNLSAQGVMKALLPNGRPNNTENSAWHPLLIAATPVCYVEENRQLALAWTRPVRAAVRQCLAIPEKWKVFTSEIVLAPDRKRVLAGLDSQAQYWNQAEREQWKRRFRRDLLSVPNGA